MTNTKQCSKCKEIKPVTEFHKDKNRKDGLNPWCKSCRKRWGETNKEKIAEYNKQYHKANKEKINEQKRRYNQTNREKFVSLEKQKKKDNPAYRLEKNMSVLMRYGATFKHLPYTPRELKEYIESLWEPWMNWDNYGRLSKNKRTWQVDHIIPRSHLIYDSPHHPNFQKCWALSNLRPLCSVENRKKHDKLLTEEK